MTRFSFALPAAVAFLILSGCTASRAQQPLMRAERAEGSLRVMTYNIHVGREGLSNVAKVIRDANPDVVGLQEVDRFTTRLGGKGSDQLAELSRLTGMPYSAYFKSSNFHGGEYGVAVLSHHPIAESAQLGLPTQNGERRTVGRALVKAPGGDVMVYVTHLTNLPSNQRLRVMQVRHILAWMAKDTVPHMLMGDFNDSVDSASIRTVKRKLVEVFATAGRGPSYTYPFTFLPNVRLDYVFASRDLTPTDVHVIHANASDHFPLVADFQQPAKAAVATSSNETSLGR